MSVNRRVFVQTVIVLTMLAVMSARVTLGSKQALTCDTVSVSILKLPYSRFIYHKCLNVFRKNAGKRSKAARWVWKGVTASRLAKLDKRRSAEREVLRSNPGRANTKRHKKLRRMCCLRCDIYKWLDILVFLDKEEKP